ncbi:class I SAM-dependent methyltransferase [candidate division KSB1 bacterium]|nr:class I SAM-dependent methyltransferase [candidate division KSB1 bacterium]
MNFKKIEDLLRFLKENGNWDSVYEHSNALEVALTSQSIDDIFGLITKDSSAPLIYESGCGSGVTTAQICSDLSERGINKYRLVAHDVRKSLVELARSRFSDNDNVGLELRSGSDYSDIPDESVDGIFSLNTMVPFLHAYYCVEKDSQAHRDYLRETSRVLTEEKPLILTYLWKSLVLVKNSKIDKDIPFRVKLYSNHPAVEIFLKVLDEPFKK